MNNTWKEKLLEWGCIHDNLYRNIDIVYENRIVYPAKHNIFRAFDECDYSKCRVVMLFQDSYANESATGIATAVENHRIPITLENMFKEITIEYGKCKVNPNLLSWCKQGVLMLNSALTVEKDSPASHCKLWNDWTTKFVKGFSKERRCVWVLVGRYSKDFSKHISQGVTLDCIHPAAESYKNGNAGFFNSNIFTRINNNLHSKIVWNEEI